MKLWTKKFTNGWGQDIRKIENNLEGIIEAVKYGSKIFTEPDPNYLDELSQKEESFTPRRKIGYKRKEEN